MKTTIRTCRLVDTKGIMRVLLKCPNKYVFVFHHTSTSSEYKRRNAWRRYGVQSVSTAPSKATICLYSIQIPTINNRGLPSFLNELVNRPCNMFPGCPVFMKPINQWNTSFLDEWSSSELDKGRSFDGARGAALLVDPPSIFSRNYIISNDTAGNGERRLRWISKHLKNNASFGRSKYSDPRSTFENLVRHWANQLRWVGPRYRFLDPEWTSEPAIVATTTWPLPSEAYTSPMLYFS